MHTDFGGALHSEYFDAFGDGGAGVVDDVAHGLVESMSVLVSKLDPLPLRCGERASVMGGAP